MSAATAQRFGAAADVRFGESLDEFLAFLTERGFDHVELRQGYLDVGETPAPETVAAAVDRHDVSVTLHAPHRDCALDSVNERLRTAAVQAVQDSVDLAAAVDAAGVVVHGGAANRRFPERVRGYERSQAVTSLRACASYADALGVTLCLENQREKERVERHTATPDRLSSLLADVGGGEHLKVALDVGHAKASGLSPEAFVDRFGDRIHVVHLHDNDGTADDHDPLPEYRAVAESIGAPYNVLEMKSLADVDRCLADGPAE